MRTLEACAVALVIGTGLVFAGLGCGNASEKAPASQEPTPTPTPDESSPVDPPAAEEEEAPEVFGAKLDPAAPFIDFAELVAKPDEYKDRQLATEGIVRANCEKRGCWMSVRPEADRAAETIMVRFKDYKFFIPIDSRGAKVKLNGKMSVILYSPEQVAELEAEGGSVASKLPDGSAKVTLFMASGVEMRGRKKK